MEESRFELRHGTQDQQVFDEVIVGNQYRLPDKLPSDHLIIDIGANIGAFAVACLLRGAGTVVCFEPSVENFAQLSKNLAAWPEQVAGFNAAVWRSDSECEMVFESHGTLTAAGVAYPLSWKTDDKTACRVASVGLDEIINQATNFGERRVNLLKVDAEYGEYAILYTSKLLSLVDEMVCETHEIPADCAMPGTDQYNCGAAGMIEFLKKQGFVVTPKRENFSNQINTLLFAKRPTPETP